MVKLPELAGLDLAALLCSRVCHDVISPVGAIANGIELLDEGADDETSEIAMDLIRSSAKNASAKLQFARIAFGAAGSAGAHIDTGDAEAVARAFFENEKKTDIEWVGERALLAKNKVKFLLNLLLVGLAAIPRGGDVKVEIFDPNGDASFKITSNGMKARVPPAFLDLLNGTFEEMIDAHAIQPIYTLQLAKVAGLSVTAKLEGESVVFEAVSA
ncbi:MAG: histidine phosphotransferase family protein [Pseudomonadota bacterium]